MKTSRRPCRRLLTALALLTVTSTAWGAAYRWTDPSGNVHYGDVPPTGVVAERMRPPSPPPLVDPEAPGDSPSAEVGDAAANANQAPAPEAADAQPAPSPEALARDRQRLAEEARQQAQAKRRNCQAARNNLEMLQRNRPVRIDQGDGMRAKRFGAEERQAAIREAQKQARENCN